MAIVHLEFNRRGAHRARPLERRCAKGGGGKAAAMPAAPLPIPPVAEKSGDVLDANLEARRAASKKFGLRKTIMAGETGSVEYGGGKPLGLTPRTVLGG